MQTKQTEVDLLMLAITAKTGTQDAFAKLLGMTRQNLNHIINQAKNNEGKLKPRFVQMLKKIHDVDIYEWKRAPYFVGSLDEVETMNKLLADPESNHLTRKMLDHLITENTDLRKRLIESEEAQNKKGSKNGPKKLPKKK